MIILTYNIRGGRGIDDRQSIARIADVIRASGADIACLQEVEQQMPGSGFEDQPKRLAGFLGMHRAYQRTISRWVGFGNLVLSRYPIVDVIRHKLTSTGEPRGILECEVETPEGPLSVFCTHWGLASDERLVQARETATIVTAVESPWIVCGDLNDGPDSASTRSLISLADLHDLAADAGVTKSTFPSDKPRARIDYILGSAELTAVRAFVIDSPASDHRAVGVEIG